jgi:hypothetical protein
MKKKAKNSLCGPQVTKAQHHHPEQAANEAMEVDDQSTEETDTTQHQKEQGQQHRRRRRPDNSDQSSYQSVPFSYSNGDGHRDDDYGNDVRVQRQRVHAVPAEVQEEMQQKLSETGIGFFAPRNLQFAGIVVKSSKPQSSSFGLSLLTFWFSIPFLSSIFVFLLCVDWSRFPLVNDSDPSLHSGDIVAYRSVTLSAQWTPALSDYQVPCLDLHVFFFIEPLLVCYASQVAYIHSFQKDTRGLQFVTLDDSEWVEEDWATLSAEYSKV